MANYFLNSYEFVPVGSPTLSAGGKRIVRNHRRDLWIFGYGSLIFKVDFPYFERRPASLRHWSRRFWQGSHDHRGTETAPGRVVTLVPARDALCQGVAYRVSPAVLEHLDYREKNGYRRVESELLFEDSGGSRGIAYIATEDNPAFLGPAPVPEIADHIARSAGPSGHNRDYLIRLADALRELGADDEHIFAIERHLLANGGSGEEP